jgi:hypothetical protein
VQRVPDLQGSMECIFLDDSQLFYMVGYRVENRPESSDGAPLGVKVSFYNGDPLTTGVFIGSRTIDGPLPIGTVEESLTFVFPVSSAPDLDVLHMVVNTQRTSPGVFLASDFDVRECDYENNFDQIALAACTPLSVEDIRLHAYRESNAVRVEWSILSPIITDVFQIDRSGSDMVFKPVGQVHIGREVQFGEMFQFIDPDPPLVETYYRLRCKLSGARTWSWMVIVPRTGEGGDVILFPNPADDRLSIFRSGDTSAIVTFHDITGKEIVVPTVDIDLFDTSNLTPGVYLVHMGRSRLRLVKR